MILKITRKQDVILKQFNTAAEALDYLDELFDRAEAMHELAPEVKVIKHITADSSTS